MPTKAPVEMPVIRPSFSLPASELPEMKDWAVGKKYVMQIEAEMTGMNKEEYIKGTPLTGRFRINKVKNQTEKPIWDQSKEEFRQTYARARSAS